MAPGAMGAWSLTVGLSAPCSPEAARIGERQEGLCRASPCSACSPPVPRLPTHPHEESWEREAEGTGRGHSPGPGSALKRHGAFTAAYPCPGASLFPLLPSSYPLRTKGSSFSSFTFFPFAPFFDFLINLFLA